MFCEKMRVAVKAMNVITFVVKKGARTVSGASAVAVAMSSPLPSCDGTTCPYRRARRGRRGRFYRDQLLGLRLELTESVQDPNDLGDADGVNEHERQDEIPVGRHREEFLPEEEDVTDFVGEHRAEGESENSDWEDPQRDWDVTPNIGLRLFQGVKLEHDRLEHHQGEERPEDHQVGRRPRRVPY